MAVAAFDMVIKKPPSRFGDTSTKELKNPSKKNKKDKSAIKLVTSGSVHFNDMQSKRSSEVEGSEVESLG